MTIRAAITEIRVSAREAENSELWVLTSAVGETLRYARDEAGYYAAEFPSYAAHWLDTWEYANQANADGFVDLAANLHADADASSRIAAFLSELGLTEHRTLFDELLAYQARHGDLIASQFARGDGELAQSHYHRFLDQFFALERQAPSINETLAAWVIGQDWLVVDPALQPETLVNARRFIAPHPDLEQLRAAELRDRQAFLMHHHAEDLERIAQIKAMLLAGIERKQRKNN